MSRGETVSLPGRSKKPDLTDSAERRRWYRQAYRQMVDKDAWEAAEQVDAPTQAYLDAMPEQAAGRYFKDPNDRYRVLGQQQLEKPEIMRRRIAAVPAWLERLPGNGAIRHVDLASLDADLPHPGEEEQIDAWMRQLPKGLDGVSSAGHPPTLHDDDRIIQLAKAPLGPRAIVADIPVDQMPRGLLTLPAAGAMTYARTGRTTTQPVHQIKPVPQPHKSGTSGLETVKALLGLNDEITPPANFATFAAQPYPSKPGTLPVDRTLPALDLQPDELRDLPWEQLADRLLSRDNYDPRDFSRKFKDQEGRQNTRLGISSEDGTKRIRRGTSPEVAAQDALDAAHELNLAKGRDWGSDLSPDNPRGIMSEYDHAVETLVKEAGDFWSERVRRGPLASEIELMRAYVKPRVIAYFPAEVQPTIKGEASQQFSLPRIKDGPQGAHELLTALVFGQVREVTINGEKVDFAELQLDSQPVVRSGNPAGSRGGPKVQRLNYLLGQALQKYLENCKEVSKSEVAGGPDTALTDGRFDGPSEAYYQNPFTPGTRGSARTDVAIRIWYGDQECIFNVNTVDINGKGALTARELRNLLRAIANAGVIALNPAATAARWINRPRPRKFPDQNAFATLPKPVNDNEADLQKAIDDFLKRLSCAKIIAACKDGNGLVDTAGEVSE